jgi:hypothetical protein
METLPFKQLRTSDVARQFCGPPSYFLIFPLRSNRFSPLEFAAREISNV